MSTSEEFQVDVLRQKVRNLEAEAAYIRQALRDAGKAGVEPVKAIQALSRDAADAATRASSDRDELREVKAARGTREIQFEEAKRREAELVASLEREILALASVTLHLGSCEAALIEAHAERDTIKAEHESEKAVAWLEDANAKIADQRNMAMMERDAALAVVRMLARESS